jgi:hypothetical protein
VDLVEEYLKGALGRFKEARKAAKATMREDDSYYRVARPGLLWNGVDAEPLAKDGGKRRPDSVATRKHARSIPLAAE